MSIAWLVSSEMLLLQHHTADQETVVDSFQHVRQSPKGEDTWVQAKKVVEMRLALWDPNFMHDDARLET